MNKLLVIGILGVYIFSCVYLFNQNFIEEDVEIEPDYKFLVYAKLAPNSQAREPDTGDIDTGITGTVNGIPVRLYASRTWANNDLGKTFIWRNN